LAAGHTRRHAESVEPTVDIFDSALDCSRLPLKSQSLTASAFGTRVALVTGETRESGLEHVR